MFFAAPYIMPTLLLQNENEEIEHIISVGADGEFERILKYLSGRACLVPVLEQGHSARS